MATTPTLGTDILDIMEEFDSQVRALKAISGLLCHCIDGDGFEPSELPYLLDPIIDNENALIEKVREVLGQKKSLSSTRVTSVRCGCRDRKRKTKTS